MAKIYVSPETLKNLSKKGGYNEILNHFDVNRPEPKQHHKTNKKDNTNKTASNKQPKVKKPKQPKSSTNIRYVTINILKQSPKKTINLASQRKVLMGDITEHRCPKTIRQSATFFYSPSTKNHNSATAFRKGKEMKNPHIHLSYLKEHHLLAGKYVSKYDNPKSQSTSIRAKNTSVIKSLKKHKKTKRDWTDRFALK